MNAPLSSNVSPSIRSITAAALSCGVILGTGTSRASAVSTTPGLIDATIKPSGFISIAKYSGDAASAGADSFLMLLVLLSLSLGFLNLLPIPILDGGQIVFQLVEWVKGGPLSDRTYMVGQQAGLLLLVLLMGVALFNDLTGLFAHS